VKDRSRFSHRVSAPIRSLTHRFAFIGLVLAAFSLMLLGKADLETTERLRAQITVSVAPILDVLSRPVATANEVIDQFRELSVVREQNAVLRDQNERLLHWQMVARKLEAENIALRDQLNFIPGSEASFVTARVIADTGGAFAHSMLLNIGARPGISKGQSVVTGAGLVGRIAGVGSRSTWVLLITDLNSRIPVLAEQTRTRAIMAGNNTEKTQLIHLTPGAVISPGDRIVTSGHGGVFPAGIPVGIVEQVNEGNITVQPFVSRERLEYVRVVDYGLRGILPDTGEAGGGKPE